MNQSVGFVYFNRNKYNLFSAQAEINCAILRNYLEKIGIETFQYCNNTLPNMLDIVDDILSEYSDFVCFYVDRYNEDFTLTITKALSENNEDTKVILIYEKEINREVDYCQMLDIHLAKERLDELLEIPTKDRLILETLDFNAYQNNYLPVNSCSEYGVVLNKKFPVCKDTYIAKVETLINEILYIARIVPDNMNISLVSEDCYTYPQWTALIEELKKIALKQKVTITIPKNQGNKELTSQLMEGNITILQPVEGEKENLKPDVDTGDIALINGMQVFYTGCYPDNILDGFTKHIQLHKDNIICNTLEKLSNYNSANSAIYCESSDEVSGYLHTKQAAEKAGYLFTNFLAFVEVKGMDENVYQEVHINGKTQGYKINISQYTEYKPSHAIHTFLNIDTKKDLDSFLEDIEYFNSTGLIRNERMCSVTIVDRCRWGINGSCKLNKLPRFRVQEGQIYPCINCNKSIGNIANQQFETIRNVSVEVDREQLDRNCEECSASVYCSKCVMLPDFLSSKDYCELMKGDIEVPRFVVKMQMLWYLTTYPNLKEFQGVNIREMKVMTRDNSIELDIKEKGEQCYINSEVLFIKILKNSTYVAFNPKIKKIFSMNGNMFAVCELLNKGLSIERVKEVLQASYQLSKENSTQVLKTAFEFLRNNSCLHKGVQLSELQRDI